MGMTQLRIAETEKYAHVTFFFNGGSETVFPGEDRVLVPSPKVATYDLQPEMSALEVCDKCVERIESGAYDVIILNFANCDMVGHTGVYEAAVKAVETVDTCVGKVVDATLKMGGIAMITADHGNAEQMEEPDGSPMTAHTTNPVPFPPPRGAAGGRGGGGAGGPTPLQVGGGGLWVGGGGGRLIIKMSCLDVVRGPPQGEGRFCPARVKNEGGSGPPSPKTKMREVSLHGRQIQIPSGRSRILRRTGAVPGGSRRGRLFPAAGPGSGRGHRGGANADRSGGAGDGPARSDTGGGRGPGAEEEMEDAPETEETSQVVSMPETPVTPEEPVVAETPMTVVSPLEGDVVTAFSMDELLYNETLDDWRTHDGVDIAAAEGSSVLAASAGTVVAVDDDALMGTTVVIEHSDGYHTLYANLQSPPVVKAGDTVSAGQLIGTVGTTAAAETAQGPHLHFSVTKDGEPVDPASFLKEEGKRGTFVPASPVLSDMCSGLLGRQLFRPARIHPGLSGTGSCAAGTRH